MTFVGIDPGLSGWLVVIDEKSVIQDAWRMPTMPTGKRREYNVPEILRRVLQLQRPSYLAMERPGVIPGQGGVSNFSIGRAFGMWEAVCALLEVSHEFVRPGDWKRALGVPAPSASYPERLRKKKLTKEEKKEKGRLGRTAKLERKKAAIAVAVRIFPSYSFIPDGSKVPDDNLAEAALLAEFARRRHSGQ